LIGAGLAIGWLTETAVGQRFAIGTIHFYRDHLSTLAAAAGYRCRFTPTCSRYAEVVITRDGVVSGGWRTIKRVARCGPWTPRGTVDEP
jgi:uncharacterized protein